MSSEDLLRTNAEQGPEHAHGRAFRMLTFWLRPAFVLRALQRFQRIAGFDRSIALASSALTATIPLAVVAGSVLSGLGDSDLGDRIIERYELSGAGAEAVHDIFAPAGGASTGIGAVGAVFVLIAVLSMARAVQRLFEQTWELPSLSVRNSVNGALWALGFIAYVVASSAIHGLVGERKLDIAGAVLVAPLTGAFLIWSGWILSAKRIAFRDLLPFGAVAAVVLAVYSVGATVYVPHQFTTYAARYGVIGAVLAMISTFVCIMIAVTASAAVGREVRDELGRIRRGERPPDHEVQREWDTLIAAARLRWRTMLRR
jgi:membrane protein